MGNVTSFKIRGGSVTEQHFVCLVLPILGDSEFSEVTLSKHMKYSILHNNLFHNYLFRDQDEGLFCRLLFVSTLKKSWKDAFLAFQLG